MILTLLALAPSAHAFCGTYVGAAGTDLLNAASQVAVARQGEHTTLTLANDFQGDATEFAVVIPVPEVLSEGDVRVVDPALFTRLDGYSAPRLVKYSCDDFRGEWADTASPAADGGGDAESGDSADGSVTVEAEFSAGEYDVVILSATESEGLVTWLRREGYGVEADAEELLGEYIAAGTFFFAAKVSLERVPEGQTWLSPIQFEYDSAAWSLPIRLGTLNSPGTQDLLVYTVTDFSDGRTGIANYPEVTVEDECMYRDDRYESFGAFWLEQLSGAFGASPAYLTEYAYGNGHCDPCTGTPPTDEDLATLGWTPTDGGGDTGWGGGGSAYFFTRLHMRYGLVGVDEDVTLYASNDTNPSQIRYIEHESFLEDRFPVCGEGMVDDPESCDDAGGTGTDASGGMETTRSSAEPGDGGCGCSTGASTGAGGLIALGALALSVARRRRA